jgi:hypothetical protein
LGQLSGVAGQIREDRLGNFLGQLSGANLPECRRMNEGQMAVDQFGKGVLGVVAGVALQ